MLEFPRLGKHEGDTMRKMNDDEAKLFGELGAYKMALDEAVKGHPYPPLLAARLAAVKQEGIAVLLAEEIPDQALTSFEETIDLIAANLRAPYP